MGECHYLEGNYEAQFVITFVHKIMKEIGINPKRLLLEWASSAEATRFVKLMTEFIDQIKGLGKLGESEDIEEETLRIRLEAAKKALEKAKLRMAFSKQAVKLKQKREKGEKIDLTLSEGLKKMIKDEFSLHQIILYLQKSPQSLSNLVDKLNIAEAEVEKYIASLEKKGRVTVKESIPVPVYVIKN